MIPSTELADRLNRLCHRNVDTEIAELSRFGFLDLSGEYPKLPRNSDLFEPIRVDTGIYSANRRANKLQATPAWADRDQMAQSYVRAREMSRLSGIKWHVDHEIPLKGALVCGLHCPANLKIVPAQTNLRKSNKYEVQ
jgi:hypothetical protein